MNYSDKRIRKLNEVSLKKLKEGHGPCNECICNLICPPPEKINLKDTLRAALDTVLMYKDSTEKLVEAKASKTFKEIQEFKGRVTGNAPATSGKAPRSGKSAKSATSEKKDPKAKDKK
ncbi:unnamed protein product [Parnassius apollo]|uniref:(apollo) hypothetical protein n=1 Tax=Parnassius apollo TaxID=110799 RepID=A0A8S3XPS8_PARAO|nr:unnamed protein product [Parnassius apollo]